MSPPLNYPDIVLSSGRMVVKSEDCAIVMDGPNSVKVSWDVNAESEFLGKRIGDKATVVLYCAERESPLVISGQHTRIQKGAVIRIPGSWQGTDVHAYVFMTSEEGKNSEMCLQVLCLWRNFSHGSLPGQQASAHGQGNADDEPARAVLKAL